ncbi:MAG TPA: DUF488 domain-containing protein [Streptosporangiaceae bacterium]|jgi:uncharacterized protein YeaO (DUF488 family)
MGTQIRVRRVYDEPEPDDGARVLVDRIWPRGMRKDVAALDQWAKDVAPSSELRAWYGHDPARFSEFRRRYAAELGQAAPRAALGQLRTLAARGPLTLLTATRDISHSQAAVLAQILRDADGGPRAGEAAAGREGGESACYAHLVCPECGAVVTEGHNQGCSSGSPR